MKLRTKFAVLLLVLTLILSLATFASLEAYKDREVRSAEDDVRETARLASEQLESRLEDHRDYVAFIAQRADATTNDSAVVGELLANSRFFAAQVVTDNRTPIVVQGPYPEQRRRELLERDETAPCVARTLSTGDICTSEPRPGSPGGNQFVVISAPIIRNNAVVGVLSAAIPLNDPAFFSLLGPLQRDSQSVSVSARGTTLNDPRVSFENNISSTATVASTGWRVTVQRDRSALAQRLGELALVQALGIFLIGLFAVTIGYWEYRVTFAQTNRLLGAFRSIERGDYDTDLSLSASEEWIQISEGFNDLVETLADRQTELREQRQRLEVLNRVLRHNLRNEMNLVIGHAERLRDGDDHDTGAVAGRIASVAEDILETSHKARRIETALGRDEPVRPLDVVPLVRDAAADAREAYPDAEIEVVAPPTATARARPVLEQAVSELVTNACEHADEGAARVTVSVEAADGAVAVTVADEGPGIPDHELAALRRGGETELEHASGLGLWAANWIVRECGGTLDFAGDDDGTTVRVRLDVAGNG